MNNRVRALNAVTSQELRSDIVAAPTLANPEAFTHEGVDYVMFTVGGNSILKPEVADQVVAYRLP